MLAGHFAMHHGLVATATREAVKPYRFLDTTPGADFLAVLTPGARPNTVSDAGALGRRVRSQEVG